MTHNSGTITINGSSHNLVVYSRMSVKYMVGKDEINAIGSAIGMKFST